MIKDKNKKIKKIIFIPEVKINIDQLNKTKIVCPISGWRDNSRATPNVTIKEKQYLKIIFSYFWLHKIKLIKIIKKGLTNSIGWNLGRKYKSNHLFDPLTSMPIRGTSNKKTNEIKKTIIEYLKSLFWSIDEKMKITVIPNIIKNKCLKKNE